MFLRYKNVKIPQEISKNSGNFNLQNCSILETRNIPKKVKKRVISYNFVFSKPLNRETKNLSLRELNALSIGTINCYNFNRMIFSEIDMALVRNVALHCIIFILLKLSSVLVCKVFRLINPKSSPILSNPAAILYTHSEPPKMFSISKRERQ